MIIDRVTMTGADDGIDPIDLLSIGREFPFVEWGILISKTKVATPRYPSFDWIAKLKSAVVSHTGDVKLAAHVCGQWTKAMLLGNMTIHEDQPGLLDLFQRIQLNFNAQSTLFEDHFPHKLPMFREHIFQIGARGGSPQMDCAFEKLPSGTCGTWAALFDRSGGNGISPKEWPKPLPNIFCGYAGGLGPENIAEELGRISEVVPEGEPIWLDMESKIRTDDKFDLTKVRACLQTVKDSGFAT